MQPASEGNRYSRQKLLWWVLGAAVSIVFGYFAFREIRWGTLVRMLSDLDWASMVLAATFVLGSFCLRAVRWRFLLPAQLHTPYRVRFFGIVIGYLVSNFLPARLGDIARPAFLARNSDAGFAVSLLSVAAERVWDLIFLFVLFLGVTTAGLVALPEQFQFDSRILFGATIVCLVVLFAAPIFVRAVVPLLDAVGLKWVSGVLSGLQEAFDSTPRRGNRIRLFAITSAILVAEIAFIAAVSDAVGLSLTPLDSAVVMVVTALSFLLPSAPGGVGVYHFFCQMALVAVGIERSDAIAASIVIHATLFLVVTVAGLIVLAACALGADNRHTDQRTSATESRIEIE